jgi:putative peptide zinc metalloprotease protein
LAGLILLAWNAGRAVTRVTAVTLRRRFGHTARVDASATPRSRDDGKGTTDGAPNTGAPAASPDALDASVFTDEFILGPPPAPPPTSGWRRAVYHATFGAVNAGPTPAERRRAELIERVRSPISGSRRVVVMSRKGGVGKTTITFALGSTYATARGDRVVAVDANPDAGNLAHRVSRPSTKTITDVLGDVELIGSYSDLRSYTSQAPDLRLEVLASNDDARIGRALDREAYHQVIELLDRYYNLILLDTGTGILDSANQGLLAEADQLVLVLRPALDGARAAALTLDWLCEHGYDELVGRAVVVINGVRRDGSIPLDRIEEHFVRRCAQVVRVPWDPALEAGAQTSLADLQTSTCDALTELAGAVAGYFSAETQHPDGHKRGESW